MRSIMVMCVLAWCASTVSYANESADALEASVTGRTPSSLAEATQLEREGNTVIISTIDNPMNTNILAWKETASEFAKNAIEFSALKDALTPTDRDQLREETQYSKVLNQTP